jgi:CCT motif
MEGRECEKIIAPKAIKATTQYLLIPAGPLLHDSRVFPCYIGTLDLNDRAAKVKMYLEKKRKRKFARHIRYQCRQSLAEKRTRLNGRFVKTSSRRSTEDEDSLINCMQYEMYKSCI